MRLARAQLCWRSRHQPHAPMPDADSTKPQTTEYDVLIVGSGFAGLCMAIRLRLAGHSYLLLEQAASLGGTWQANRYPGAACDIPSSLYCFSFAPNPDWSRAYPAQAEIEGYLNHCADCFGVRTQMRFNHTVTAARFDEQRRCWRIEVGNGAQVFHARSLILATGGLSRPKLPAIAGIEQFAGPCFHTARWPADAALAGKRVGIIGTGASAIQVLPSIVDDAAHVSVFQRTPAWIIGKPNWAVSRWRKALYRLLPSSQRVSRVFNYWRHELFAVAFTRVPALLRVLEILPRLQLRWQVRDRQLRARLTPSYRVGCKRVLLSSTFYPTLCRDDVELVTMPIARINATGIETSGGVHHRLDVLISCTGFEAAEACAPFPVAGRDGLDLDQAWCDGQNAYLGTTVSGFPNLFIMSGPNTALGHNSMVYMIEAQANYVSDAIAHLARRPGAALDVDAIVQREYNIALQQRLARTVWNTGGCSSWYRTRDGLNTTLWPDFTFVFRHRLRRFDPASYHWLG